MIFFFFVMFWTFPDEEYSAKMPSLMQEVRKIDSALFLTPTTRQGKAASTTSVGLRFQTPHSPAYSVPHHRCLTTVASARTPSVWVIHFLRKSVEPTSARSTMPSPSSLRRWAPPPSTFSCRCVSSTCLPSPPLLASQPSPCRLLHHSQPEMGCTCFFFQCSLPSTFFFCFGFVFEFTFSSSTWKTLR